jgi:hypothetical protein
MRRVLSALASTVVAGAAVLAGAAPASATARHVGVVVRYANGRVSAGCTTLGGSGLQVLERKHSVTMGTQQYSGFVLKIDGVGTSRPDNTHYWSYWHSNGHGSWTYSSSGAASSTPRAGTIEGWSYVNGQNSAPHPRSYTYAALCGHLDPKPAPKSTPQPTPQRTSTPQSTAHAAPTPTHNTPPDPTTTTHAQLRTASSADMAPPLPNRHRTAAARSRSAHPRRGANKRHPTSASPTAASSATTSSGAVPAPTSPAPRRPASSPVAQPVDSSTTAAWPTIGALCVIAALGLTAWLVARRRAG